ILHTRRTARAAGHGAQSTGPAGEGGATRGALGGQLLVPARDTAHREARGCRFSAPAADRAPDALLGGVDRGIYVLDFWYPRILDPRTQVVSGLTRNGVWLIEDGKVGRALRKMRLTHSY